MNILTAMSKDHSKCDQIFFELETEILARNWHSIAAILEKYVVAMEKHFHIEEDLLFSSFEQITGSTNGPTSLMSFEHSQMRMLFRDIQFALKNTNEKEMLDTLETLQIMMQQHNMKEENILYPMLDRFLNQDILESIEKNLSE
jgi:hemerythrin-like domain-containing protein